MDFDISELYEYASRENTLISSSSVKLQDGKLRFVYSYLNHLPNPFMFSYDNGSKDFFQI